jgi:peptidoglycan hydrolase-like protein with peptidoglycan-binding domain
MLLFKSKQVILSFKLFIITSFLLGGFVVMSPLVQADAADDAMLLATIQELTRIVAALQLQIANGGVPPPPAPVVITDFFTAPVVLNATNDSIKLLQSILKTDPAIYPEGITSGLFGPLTEAALRRFQAAYSLPASGVFTTETEAIFNSVLRSIPLSTYSYNYLLQTPVKTRIQTAADEYILVNTLNAAGDVVLRTNPVFSATTKSTDTATLQRILRTDVKIYPEAKISGLMDTVTNQAVMRLRTRYGIPYKIPSSGVVNIANLMSASTTQLLRDILVKNDSGVIQSNLLLLSSVQPINLISNSVRELSVIQATRNYRTNKTEVRVNYDGGTIEEFTTTTVSPSSAVSQAIATKLGRSVDEVRGVIVYGELYGDDFKEIILTVTLLDEMDIDIEYMNSTTENIPIGEEEIQAFVDYAYSGNYDQYRADFAFYVNKARSGESLDEVDQLVADLIGVTKAEVADILTYNVEPYFEGGGEGGGCGGGGCGGD